MTRCTALFALVLLVPAPGVAQQRPLVTEDPETIGSGLVLLEGGVEALRDISFPLSGLTGNLLRFPVLGASFGVSSIAEVQFDWAPYQRLSVTERIAAPASGALDFTGTRTSDTDDITIGTKIRVLPETAGRPAFGLRFVTRLPNAGNESGLGLDTMDFYIAGLVGKTVQSIRVVGNAGVGILSDPTRGDRQNDVVTYGLSLARAVSEGVEVVGDVNGRLSVAGRCASAAASREARCAWTVA